MKCHLKIDNKPYSFDFSGDAFWGKDEVLYNVSGRILDRCVWDENGYDIIKILNDKQFQTLKACLKKNCLISLNQSHL